MTYNIKKKNTLKQLPHIQAVLKKCERVLVILIYLKYIYHEQNTKTRINSFHRVVEISRHLSAESVNSSNELFETNSKVLHN